MINEAITRYKSKIKFHQEQIKKYKIRIEYLIEKKRKIQEEGQRTL